MSLTAAILDALIAAGATREQIVAAMKADIAEREADEAARLETKRECNRERQRRHRASRDVTPVTRDACDNNELVSPNKETPQTPKEINPHPRTRDARARAKTLPDNWQPEPFKPDGQAGLIAARKPVGWIERELSKFKDHALQNRRLCADWNAAWRNWVKRADEYDGQQRTNGLARNQPNDGLSSTTRAALRVFGPGDEHAVPR